MLMFIYPLLLRCIDSFYFSTVKCCIPVLIEIDDLALSPPDVEVPYLFFVLLNYAFLL
uniref:Uncharacterized protein n=1 Tax=Setaria viridis TaxID=4556 RepID=A0A4U6V6P6_SETVI|nr:hypothetical protein SEVIR_3G002133v2 [Setaria viridis]